MHKEIILALEIILFFTYLLGLFSAFHSIMHTKTSQSAIAWSIALVTFPHLTLPFYWIFSRNKFHGYIQAFRSRNKKIRHIVKDLRSYLPEFVVDLEENKTMQDVLAKLTETPFTGNNSAEILIDGEAAFGAMFKAIEKAESYVLVQFYIMREDKLGCKLKSKLAQAKKRGVRAYVLYDEIGSYSLSKTYIESCKKEGIDIRPFKTAKGKSNRFQINFRNHRKIVVVDGNIAFVGGLNVGDEYVGLHPRLTPWRDTHVEIKGPSVQCVQISFIEDWYWATDNVLELDWVPSPAKKSDVKTLVLTSGPADDFETCNLFFANTINSAKSRLWIASPYFVPDDEMVCALKLAALRGVDVRIIVPKIWDKKFIWLAAFSFFEEVMPAGVKIYFYEKGFMHQKVMLVDDDISTIGTANFDNRSFRWNFEISLVFFNSTLAGKVEKMLKDDLDDSKELKLKELEKKPFWFRLRVRITRLFSQLL